METLHILVVFQVSFAQILKAALQNITLSDLYSKQFMHHLWYVKSH